MRRIQLSLSLVDRKVEICVWEIYYIIYLRECERNLVTTSWISRSAYYGVIRSVNQTYSVGNPVRGHQGHRETYPREDDLSGYETELQLLSAGISEPELRLCCRRDCAVCPSTIIPKCLQKFFELLVQSVCAVIPFILDARLVDTPAGVTHDFSTFLLRCLT